MNLIAGKIPETLDLKGCFIKLKSPRGGQIELLARCGLTDKFLFSESDDRSDCICSNLPGNTICIPRLQKGETTGEREFMMIEGIEGCAVLSVEAEREVITMVALFAGAPREFAET